VILEDNRLVTPDPKTIFKLMKDVKRDEVNNFD